MLFSTTRRHRARRTPAAAGLITLIAGLAGLCGFGAGVAGAHESSSTYFGAGVLGSPQSLTVTGGEIFVADTFARQIRVFGPDGQVRRSFATGPSDLQEQPYGVAVTGGGYTYAAEPRFHDGSGRVEVFDPSGGPVGLLGSGLKSPRALTIDGLGSIYVAEYDGTVRRFMAYGNPDASFNFQWPPGTVDYLYPTSVAVGPERLLVASRGGVTVHRLDGSFERSVGYVGDQVIWDGTGHFITFDALKLRRFKLDGTLVSSYDLPARTPSSDDAFAGGILQDALWIGRPGALERLDLRTPKAQVKASSTAPAPTDTVALDASASKPPALGSITRYQWDLNGDGNVDRDTGTAPTTAFSPARPGPLRVTVWVQSGRGAGSSSANLTLDVREPVAPTTPTATTPTPNDPSAPQSQPGPSELIPNNGGGGNPSTGHLVPSSKRPSIEVGFKRKVRLAGKLVDGTGTAIAGAQLDVFEAVGGGARGKVTSLTTDAKGRYTYSPRTRSNRVVDVSYSRQRGSATYQSSHTLRIGVRAGVHAALKRSRIPSRGKVTVTGRVSVDGLPSTGVVVEIRARQRGRWVGTGVVRTDGKGRFHWSHRTGISRGTFPLQARVLKDPGMPALPAESRTLLLRIG